MHALIEALGGIAGDNGGLIETSGATLDAAGAAVTAAAPKGKPGSWLLDPTDLIIDQTLATSIASTLAADTSVVLMTSASSAPTLSNGATLKSGEQNTAGNGDIIVNAPLSWTTNAALTHSAYHNVTVNQPISLSTGSLTLTANNANVSGSAAGVAVNANITVSGAGHVALNAPSTTVAGTSSRVLDLTFAQGASLSLTGTNMTTGAPLGTLSINGTGYTLLNALANAGSIGPDSGSKDIAGINHASENGHYALVVNLPDTGTTFTSPPGGAGSNTFCGTLEGLGHAISNLTINTSATYGGLVGQSDRTLRDLGLVGGAVSSGGNDASVDGLVGFNDFGTITQAYAAGVVGAGGANVGGLVGYNASTLSGSYWDTMTSGTTTGIGGDTSSGANGYTTAATPWRQPASKTFARRSSCRRRRPRIAPVLDPRAGTNRVRRPRIKGRCRRGILLKRGCRLTRLL